jgi:hypothetical protein
MVITSRILQDQLGINSYVADYFANLRPIPADNLFWQNKRIYLSVGFGFLTIPFAFDLMHKRGIELERLLEDRHVSLMERGFHFLKQYENNLIDQSSFIAACKELLEGSIRQPHLAADLFALFTGKSTRFFQFEQTHKALARSDFFLFTLTDLELSDKWVNDFMPYWYALARPILLLDDFKDIEEDKNEGEENTILEWGGDKHAVEKAYALGKSDLKLLATVNAPLADFIGGLLDDSLSYAPIKALLN